MTKYLLLLAVLTLIAACAEDDGNFYAGLEWTMRLRTGSVLDIRHERVSPSFLTQ